MDLDMYLYYKIFVFGKYGTENKIYEIPSGTHLSGNKPKVEIQLRDISSIDLELGYWRKNVRIHKWFINNCAEGVDDCKEFYVKTEKLVELKNICERIVGGDKEAFELLPEIDEQISFEEIDLKGIAYTAEILDVALKKVVGIEGAFFYRASW